MRADRLDERRHEHDREPRDQRADEVQPAPPRGSAETDDEQQGRDRRNRGGPVREQRRRSQAGEQGS